MSCLSIEVVTKEESEDEAELLREETQEEKKFEARAEVFKEEGERGDSMEERANSEGEAGETCNDEEAGFVSEVLREGEDRSKCDLEDEGNDEDPFAT